ncbi:ParB N-terminal domain-containing protein [Acaryochloris sp. CCMEE 5410]|uniref:ParB N-terminal domain-containing protein n=1 Tax=Acaryochloris sp. CCMEE 5410 TaxID=310037 RepID=UPI00024847DF|nr:ParB N-terminal domain-containing protein [Acaryochloris sp. CCMEE 5410]KAI9131258.1 ParB N-terminal domain-containing protein [Acaryochloris sp. CCMEE 5410]
MTEYYLVDVKSITSNQPRSSFDEDDLDKLAKSILESEILLKPLVLDQTGPESYEVLDGHFEYYGAVRAKEINPRSGEMVSAFVISPKEKGNVSKQISILSKPAPSDSISTNYVPDQRLSNIEARLDRAIADIKDEFKRENQRLNNELSELKSLVPQKVDALEALNSLSEVELTLKLRRANITGKTLEKIKASIVKERKKRAFHSLSDVVSRVEGLGDKRMLTIIDAWNGTF